MQRFFQNVSVMTIASGCLVCFALLITFVPSLDSISGQRCEQARGLEHEITVCRLSDMTDSMAPRAQPIAYETLEWERFHS